MDLILIVAALGVALAALTLARSIEWIALRLGMGPARPDVRSQGFRDVVDRVRDRLNRSRS